MDTRSSYLDKIKRKDYAGITDAERKYARGEMMSLAMGIVSKSKGGYFEDKPPFSELPKIHKQIIDKKGNVIDVIRKKKRNYSSQAIDTLREIK